MELTYEQKRMIEAGERMPSVSKKIRDLNPKISLKESVDLIKTYQSTFTKVDRNNQIYKAIELVTEAQRLVDNTLSETARMEQYEFCGKFGFDELLGNKPYTTSLISLIED